MSTPVASLLATILFDDSKLTRIRVGVEAERIEVAIRGLNSDTPNQSICAEIKSGEQSHAHTKPNQESC